MELRDCIPAGDYALLADGGNLVQVHEVSPGKAFDVLLTQRTWRNGQKKLEAVATQLARIQLAVNLVLKDKVPLPPFTLRYNRIPDSCPVSSKLFGGSLNCAGSNVGCCSPAQKVISR